MGFALMLTTGKTGVGYVKYTFIIPRGQAVALPGSMANQWVANSSVTLIVMLKTFKPKNVFG